MWAAQVQVIGEVRAQPTKIEKKNIREDNLESYATTFGIRPQGFLEKGESRIPALVISLLALRFLSQVKIK